MQVALIPPLCFLPWTFVTEYQLALPHLFQYSEYNIHYGHLAKTGYHVILDNGAAESKQVDNLRLWSLATELDPEEMVLPDVIGDSEGTIKAVDRFLRTMESRPNCAMGVVAAGKNINQATHTVKTILDRHSEFIDIIYLPRSLVTDEDRFQRIRLAQKIRDYTSLPIHFLGTNPRFLGEVERAADLGDVVRSIDTSAPFNYAWDKRRMTEFSIAVHRPKGYFEKSAERFDRELIVENVDTLIGWANGSAF